MKKVGITQRVMPIPAYKERRDELDQRWSALALALDLVPIPLPNISPEHLPLLLDTLQLDAVLLSGGNSLVSLEPDSPDRAPERDAFEAKLIEESIKRDLPLLGICRGMQMLQSYFGGSLEPVLSGAGAGIYHELSVTTENNTHFSFLNHISVNTYHNWGIAESAPGFTVFVRDSFGQIEGFFHSQYRIAGLMWHPEREYPYKKHDIQLMRQFLWL